MRLGFVGPANCGKTVLAEYYADLVTEPNLNAYNATAGVRIIESERKIQVHEDDAPVNVPI